MLLTVLKEEMEDIGQCLQTISRRPDGLIRFVNDFRNLTTISVPQVERFNVNELLKEIKTLQREQLANKLITLAIDFPYDTLRFFC
jgi:two-component system, NtrC family, nitrogen regulation sensor histidine kinase NtrY